MIRVACREGTSLQVTHTIDLAPGAPQSRHRGLAFWLVVKVWPVIVLVSISLMLVATLEPG